MKNITPENLTNFSGSENVYRHFLGQLNYTDGIHFLTENGAAWLIDAIASYQYKFVHNFRLQEFQLWCLKFDPNNPSGAILTCRDDTGKGSKEYVRQVIEYTDFPLKDFNGSFKIYVENGMILLPSEK